MIYNRFLFILLFCICSTIIAVENTHFAMIITSYNNEKWCIQNIRSCVNQKYPFWTLYYINDCSTDRTGEVVGKYIKDRGLKNRCHLINNTIRKGALRNLYEIIKKCNPTHVIVTVDGDDFLAHDNVLDIVAEAYKNPSTWITYGNYIKYPDYEKGRCKPFPNKIQSRRNYRKYRWVSSHLRTFRAGLFQCIRKDDLKWNGLFYPTTWDLAMMFPMLEMASDGHIMYIDKILYLYNTQNPISDCKAHREQQQLLDKQIRLKKKYSPLKSYLKIKR